MFGEEAPPPDEWLFGLLLALALHGFQFILVPLTNWYSLMFLGVSQLLYLLPAIALCKHQKRDDYVKGLIVGASLTFLLNATCLAYLKSIWPP